MTCAVSSYNSKLLPVHSRPPFLSSMLKVSINLERWSSFLVSSRRQDSVVSMRRGLCVSDSSVSSVLNTSKSVTLACNGVGNAGLERVSAR